MTVGEQVLFEHVMLLGALVHGVPLKNTSRSKKSYPVDVSHTILDTPTPSTALPMDATLHPPVVKAPWVGVFPNTTGATTPWDDEIRLEEDTPPPDTHPKNYEKLEQVAEYSDVMIGGQA